MDSRPCVLAFICILAGCFWLTGSLINCSQRSHPLLMSILTKTESSETTFTSGILVPCWMLLSGKEENRLAYSDLFALRNTVWTLLWTLLCEHCLRTPLWTLCSVGAGFKPLFLLTNPFRFCFQPRYLQCKASGLFPTLILSKQHQELQ